MHLRYQSSDDARLLQQAPQFDPQGSANDFEVQMTGLDLQTE